MGLLTKYGTHNNTVLRIVAAVLFIIIPIGGFMLGMKYGEAIKICTLNTETRFIKVRKDESDRELLRRCGPIPNNAYFKNKYHYDVVDGPVWSPDCRNVAYSMWESGTSYLGSDLKVIEEIENSPKKLSGREGVFVYNEASDKTRKIYAPTQLNETPVFEKWEDRNTIIFKTGQNRYRYDLVDSKLEKIVTN